MPGTKFCCRWLRVRLSHGGVPFYCVAIAAISTSTWYELLEWFAALGLGAGEFFGGAGKSRSDRVFTFIGALVAMRALAPARTDLSFARLLGRLSAMWLPIPVSWS